MQHDIFSNCCVHCFFIVFKSGFFPWNNHSDNVYAEFLLFPMASSSHNPVPIRYRHGSADEFKNTYCFGSWFTISICFQQPDITCCYTVPGRCHSRHIIKHMTFRLFNRSKIRHNFFGFHYNLSQKQNTRAYNFCYHAHHTDNCIHLFQIFAM